MVLGYVIYSDPILYLALLSAVIVFALNLMLIMVAALLRATSIFRARRDERLRSIWRPLFAQAIASEIPVKPSAVKSSDASAVLRLWLHFQESVEGEAHSRLNHVARDAGFRETAMAMLRSGDLLQRFIAITTLGHLGDRGVWEVLEREVRGDNPYLSLAAAQALVRIDPVNAIPLLLPLAKTRRDWSPSRVFLILLQIDRESLAEPLANAMVTIDDFPPAHFIRYLEALPGSAAMRSARTLLSVDAPIEVICTCLELLHDPADVDLARQYLPHSAWQVRVHAAKALGRVGLREDVPRLCGLLSDYEWWVRYRAAEAIVQMPFVTSGELAKIKANLVDHFASDMLDQAVAEQRLRSSSPRAANAIVARGAA